MDSVKQLPYKRLIELQVQYYNTMLEKQKELFFDGPSSSNRDEIVTYKNRKRGPDDSFQFDRIMKSSTPFNAVPKLLNGTPYFRKGPYNKPSIDIGTRNNCPKANVPTLTIFHCINLRQTQKGLDKDGLNYVGMKILAQVNCVRNASEDEMRLAKNNDPNSDFLYCTFPIHKDTKLKGVDKHICMITVLGDPGTCCLTVVFLMSMKRNFSLAALHLFL